MNVNHNPEYSIHKHCMIEDNRPDILENQCEVGIKTCRVAKDWLEGDSSKIDCKEDKACNVFKRLGDCAVEMLWKTALNCLCCCVRMSKEQGQGKMFAVKTPDLR